MMVAEQLPSLMSSIDKPVYAIPSNAIAMSIALNTAIDHLIALCHMK